MYGVVCVLEYIRYDKEFYKNFEKGEDNQEDIKDLENKYYYQFGPYLGQVIHTIKDGVKMSYLNGEPRLFEATYLCTFQIALKNLGQIYPVISKRRGEIISESSNLEGNTCTIEAIIPIAECFGFVTEIRKKSSGLANPILEFYKWQILNIDPFYIPSTKEEIETHGTNIDTPNISKNFINAVRTRKGMSTDEKLVKNANQQINLGKNK